MALSSTEAGSTSQSVQDTESASDVALSRHSDSSDQEENDDGRNKLTEKWLLKFFSNDWKHYYRTFELNEKLYLHFKGKNFVIHCFARNLGNFPNLTLNLFSLLRLRKDQMHGEVPSLEDFVLRRQRSQRDQWPGDQLGAALPLHPRELCLENGRSRWPDVSFESQRFG